MKLHAPVPFDADSLTTDETFFDGYGYRPAIVHSWEWSTTFGRWGAVVIFTDRPGTDKLYTYPRTISRDRSHKPA